jgi:hypothetical protein
MMASRIHKYKELAGVRWCDEGCGPTAEKESSGGGGSPDPLLCPPSLEGGGNV